MQRIRIPKTVRNLSGLVFFIGCVVVTGWIFNISVLKSVVPGFITMKLNTALGFILISSAILRFHSFSKKKSARALGFVLIGLLAALSVATLAEYIFNVNLGIDEFFMPDPDGVTRRFPPGRLAPITAINFICLSLSLFLTENPWKKKFGFAQVLNFSVFLISMQAFVASLIGVKSSFGYAFYTQMALHTTLLFVCSSVAVTFLHAEKGFSGIVLSRTAAGMMARRFILVAVFISPVIQCLTLFGQREEWLDENSSMLVRMTGTAAFLVLLVWKTASEMFQVEKSLSDHKQRYDVILSSSDTVLFSIDMEGKFTFSEGRALSRLGLTSGEQGGQSVFELYKDFPEILNAIGLAMIGESNKIRFFKSGCWLECHFSPARGPSGKIDGVVGLTIDVTEQVQIDHNLRETRDRLQKVVNHTPVVLWATDEKGTLTLSDGSGLTGLGLEPGQLVGTPVREFCADQKELVAGIDRAYQGEIVEVPSEYNGRSLEQIITPIFDEQKKVKGLVGLSIDVTSRRKSEEDRSKQEVLRKERDLAEQATRAKSMFLANMSHEIRTPIHGILGLNWLMMETSLTAEQRELAHTIKSSSENLLRIVNDVLDFSKVEAGELQLEKREFSLMEVLDQAAACVRFSAENKKLFLRVKMEPGMPDAWMGDGGRIQQVLTNFLGNAVKFTAYGGVEIRVNLAARNTVNESIRIEVKDTGVGIPTEAKGKIFEAFSQADVSTTRKFGGTGLGLSIAKKYVEAMNGIIGFESRENEGSTFWFHIPLPRATKAVSGASISSQALIDQEVKDSARLKILVAEDNPTNQLVIYRMLQKFGYQPVVVNDGLEALKRLEAEAYDLVLMDCQMPRMDGYEATRLIRAHSSEDICHLPVIALTADVSETNLDRCLQSGMTDVLTKPISAQDLRNCLQTLGELLDDQTAAA